MEPFGVVGRHMDQFGSIKSYREPFQTHREHWEPDKVIGVKGIHRESKRTIWS
jgi:hypothetical protein